MTLPNTDIYEEFTVTTGQTSFTLGNNVGYIPQDVDESLKVFIREDAREFLPTNVNTADNYIVLGDHAYSNSIEVLARFTTTGNAPDGLTNGEEYFVQYVDENNVKLSLTSGGSTVGIADQGTGTHKLEPVDPNGIELALNTDFTVTKVNQLPTEINFSTREGVTGQKLFVVRQSSVSQEDVDYTFATPWKPVEYETHVDKIYAILQEQGNKLSRALLTRVGDTTSSNLTFPVPKDNHSLGWYEIGSGKFALRNYDISGFVTDIELAEAQATIQANIDANTSLISNNTTNILANTSNIIDNINSINALQEVANTVGTVTLTNNATVTGPQFGGPAILHFEVLRSDDGDTRRCVGTLKILQAGLTWYVSDPEYFIPVGNPPGITFAMSTDTIQITSDNMTGGGPYTGTLTYTIIKI